MSVILPVRNRSDWLPAAVDSVLDQTFADWELCVVDDGSTEDLRSALGSRLEDARVSLVRCPPSGVSAARNLGVSVTSAPWIAFLDSDDTWFPPKLEEQLAYAATRGFSVVQSEDLWMRGGVRVNPPQRYRKREGDLFAASCRDCQITPTSVLLRRAVFLEAGGFDPEIPAAEDFDLWLRLTLNHPIGLCPEIHSVRHGGRADQLSALPGLDRYRLTALAKILALLPDEDPRRKTAAEAWAEKLAIFEIGCRKRANDDGLEFCAAQKRRFPEWVRDENF